MKFNGTVCIAFVCVFVHAVFEKRVMTRARKYLHGSIILVVSRSTLI